MLFECIQKNDFDPVSAKCHNERFRYLKACISSAIWACADAERENIANFSSGIYNGKNVVWRSFVNVLGVVPVRNTLGVDVKCLWWWCCFGCKGLCIYFKLLVSLVGDYSIVVWL